jgi:hypothetical protein
MMPRTRVAMLYSASHLPTSSVGATRLACKSPRTRYHRQHTIDRHVLTRDYSAARPYHPFHARREPRFRPRHARPSAAGARLQRP